MMNFQNAISRCSVDSIKIQMKRIEPYAQYTALCETSSRDYLNLRNMFEYIPLQVREFFKLINGGYLFDTQLLSSKLIDTKTGIRLQMLDIYNSDTVRNMTGLPKRYAPFALASFGDLYCFCLDGSETIIQWSTVSHKVVEKWKDISTWLKQEIDIAIELIKEECMTPMGAYNE